MLGVAVGGLAVTAGLLATLAPEPLDDASLSATTSWRGVEVLASGGSVASAEALAEASGEALGPSHFVIARDGGVTTTPRWERQLPPASAYGPGDSISIVLLGDAADLTAEQRDAADALISELSRQLGPLERR